MARRVIRRRRLSGQRVVRRRVAPDEAVLNQSRQATAPAISPDASKVLLAVTATTRNLILPKMASMGDIALAGIADSFETSLKMLMQERPEVAILDADFGGDHAGYDTARTMQTTRTRAAILMIVSEIDPEKYRPIARRLGTSWSYVRRNSALKVDVFEVSLKSALRGVQWIEPELTRPLKELWTIAAKARELEEKKSLETPVAVKNASRKMRPVEIPQKKSESEQPEVDTAEIAADVEDEIAPGIETQNTNDVELDDFKYTSVSIGHGGVGQDVKGVRRVS